MRNVGQSVTRIPISGESGRVCGGCLGHAPSVDRPPTQAGDQRPMPPLLHTGWPATSGVLRPQPTPTFGRLGQHPQVFRNPDLAATVGSATEDGHGHGETARIQLYSGHVFGDHIYPLKGVPWSATKQRTSNNAIAVTALAIVGFCSFAPCA